MAGRLIYNNAKLSGTVPSQLAACTALRLMYVGCFLATLRAPPATFYFYYYSTTIIIIIVIVILSILCDILIIITMTLFY